jgi:hypothetical protein
MWTLYIGDRKIVSCENKNVVKDHFWILSSTQYVDFAKQTLTGYNYDESMKGYVLSTVSYRIVKE